MKITLTNLISSKNDMSSKRFILVILTYFLMFITAFLFLPIEIKTNNLELLKITIGAFTAIIITGFTANAVETVKLNKQNGNTEPDPEPS